MGKKTVWVRLINFAKYKGRSDVTYNNWFRCSNRLLEDPDFFSFNAGEILAWIYMLSVSSQKNTDVFEINFNHACRVCRIKNKDLTSAIKKLQGKQLLLPGDPISDVTDAVRERNVDGTDPCETRQNKTKQDKTKQNKTATSDDIERVYNDYPLKKGKTKGIQFLLKDLRDKGGTPADVGKAILKYKATLERDKTPAKFIKHFSTFAHEWRDYLDEDAGTTTVKGRKYENERDIDHDAEVRESWGFS